MGIDDPLLPAAAHLSGPHAGDVIRPAVEHAGGSLGRYRCSRLHYRPGRHLIAQFRAAVDWGDGRPRRETIIAATTSKGPPPGTVVVTAEMPGTDLTVGVWRWPFDPSLPALEGAVTGAPNLLAEAGVVRAEAPADVEVVTYRPTDRAVLRITTPETTWYLKVVRPTVAARVVRRHRLLSEWGLPVPEVLAADLQHGWMLVSELAGPTLRTLIKSDADRWVEPATLYELIGRIASIDGDAPRAFRSRLADGAHHASLLASVLPAERERLARLSDALLSATSRAEQRPRGFIHGDLHEGQLIVGNGRVSGLLDIDEAGFGDPVDDIAVPAAHLRHRALTAPNGARIDAFVDGLTELAHHDHAPDDIAAATAAVLAGLATAPFRAQSDGWQDRVGSVLDLADRHVRLA